MKNLTILIAILFSIASAGTGFAATNAKVYSKQTKSTTVKKKTLPPTSTVRPVVKTPKKVTRKAVLTRKKK